MLPSTTKEQRETLYGDLSSLVALGFLSSRVQIGDLSLGLRSLSLNDTNLLRKIAREGGDEWPLHLAAASVWMVNGLPLLEGHPYTYQIALNLLKKTHKSLVRMVFAQAVSFFRRMRDANLLFESFLYEDESRRLWKSTNRGAHPLWIQTGIPGLDRLGLNQFQTSWVQWNRSEDDRIDDDYTWSMTKVLVSVQSSKGAKKLDARDKARLETENARRAEAQDRAYYIAKGLLDAGTEKAQSILKVSQPRTAKELSEEMRRWVAGEKDIHDLAVEDYKNRIKVEFEERERQAELVLQQARERAARAEEAQTIPSTALVGFTRDQLAKMRPNQGGAKFIIEANPISKTYNKYLRDNPDAGALDVRGGRVVVKNPSISLLEDEGERQSPPTLNELIANRKPSL